MNEKKITKQLLLMGAMAFALSHTGWSQSVVTSKVAGSNSYSATDYRLMSDYLDSLRSQMMVVRDSVHDLGVVQAYQQISLSSASLQITGQSLMDSLRVMNGSALDGNVVVGGNLSISGTTTGITASMVGLGNVDNTLDADKPVSTAAQAALDLKAPLASPTFTGTVSGVTAAMVGLGNVDNTSDADKPVSSAAQSALDLKAPLASPTFTGTVSGVTAAMVGLGNVDNTADADKPVSTATQTALDLKAPLASPTFTGTVSGVTASMVGLGNVDNTSDADKPVSTATQTALDLKAPLASPTFTGTPSLPTGTTAVTQSASDNSTKLATTAYVDAAVSGAGSATTEMLQEVTVASDNATAFTLSQTPAATSVVRMYRNGILLSGTAMTVSGTDVTYVPANNGGANLVTGDRIQFFYAY